MVDDNITGAVLTPKQREFLREGPDETKSSAAARMTRGRIEERVRAAILEDAPLLANTHDIDPAINLEKIAETGEAGEVAEGIRSMVAVLYRLGDAVGANPEKAITDGMNEARGERLARILEKLDSNSAATVPPDELRTLNDHGYIPDDVHAQLFKRWLGSQGNISVEDVREVMDREDWR